jgi:hypothetical protein|tara:strand:- start:2553 stop:3857 length:1305 start_codon:yes stop_codon:yes gene_type:complete
LVVVETDKEFESFAKSFSEFDSIVIPIECDFNKHPKDTNLCLLFVKTISENSKEFILPFRHADALNLSSLKLENIWTSKTVFTYDKKKLLSFFDWKNVSDVNMRYYLEQNDTIDLEGVTTNSHEFFARQYYKKSNINCVIPLMKHLEWCRKMVEKIKLSIFAGRKENDSVFKIYNEDVLESLQTIESNGIQTTNGMVYSEYNPYTATGRPSNRFGGLNFAALNKKDGSRKQFISRFGEKGMLVEMDYDAYHLRLIGDVVDYKFPKGSVHKHMAKLYNTSYDEAKGLSFQYLYGHIPDEVIKTNPFFAKVQVYIDDVWKRYKSNNFIESDIYSKRIYRKNLSDMNKNKVFNYLIQLMETENNMKMLSKLLPKIQNFNSKLVLYNYDSFLFDFHIDDGLKFVKMVKKVIEQNKKYPVKVSKGSDYHTMRDITEKFE